MKKKILTLMFPVSAMILAGCGEHQHTFDTNKWDSDDSQHWHPATCGHDVKDSVGNHIDENNDGKCDVCLHNVPIRQSRFASIVNNVNQNHNYTLSIYTHLDNDDGSYDYSDYQKNINDKALFMDGQEAGFTNYGIVSLKDKGYVWFGSSSSGVIGETPYSTRFEKGVHELFDLNLENLLACNFVQDASDINKYSSTDENALTIMYNYSGYSYSWATDDGVVNLVVDENEDKLTFSYGFNMYYYDPVTYDEVVQHAVATVTATNFGSTHDFVIESFIENPTAVYPVKSGWSAAEELVFQQKFQNLVPSFIPNVTWTFDLESEQEYDGVHIYASDLDSGDQRANYGNLLIQNDGFEKIDDNQYKKTFVDVESQKITTWTVNMIYHAPSEEYNGKTWGDYFKNGYFQVEYYAKQENVLIDTVAKLNNYMSANGYDKFAPLFPVSPEATSVSKFNDKTSGTYAFYTGTAPFKVNFADSASAKEFVQSYISLLESKGYTKSGGMFGQVNYCLKNTPNESFVALSDPQSVGTFAEIRFNLYSEDFEDPVLKGIEISGYTTKYSVGDDFEFDGEVTAYYTTKAPQKVMNYTVSDPDMTTAGVKDVTVSYTEDGVTKTAKYQIQVGVGERILRQGVMENCSISKINGSYNTDDVPVVAGSKVTVQLSIGTKYRVTEIKVTDSKGGVVVPTLVEGETKIYEFVMPDSDSVISVKAVEVVVLSSITVTGAKSEFAPGESFSYDGLVVTAHYSDDSSKTVSPKSVSTPDISKIGKKYVTVKYEEDGIEKQAQYQINIAAALSFDGDEHVSLVKFVDLDGNEITKFNDASNQTFGMVLDLEDGYGIASGTVNGDDIDFEHYFLGYDDEIGAYTLWVDDITKPAYAVSLQTISVSPTPEKYNVSKSQGEGTSVTLSGTEFDSGETVTFSASLNSGYESLVIEVEDENEQPVSYSPTGSTNEYSFTMPASDVTITTSATKSEEPTLYHVDKVSGLEGGRVVLVTPSAPSDVEAGSTVKFKATADENYTLEDVFIVDHPEIQIDETPGMLPGQGSTYSFVMPEFDVVISASFEGAAPAKAWHVQADSSMEHGSIAFAESYYDTGEKVEFSVTPDSGYELDTLSSNPSLTITDEGDGNYSFLMPASDVTVSATFKESAGPAPEAFSGTFVNGSGEFAISLVFNENGTGSYMYYGMSIEFTFVKDGSTLTLTKTSGDEDNFGSKKLFMGQAYVTATINGDGNVVAKIGSMTMTAQNKTFTKQ